MFALLLGVDHADASQPLTFPGTIRPAFSASSIMAAAILQAAAGQVSKGFTLIAPILFSHLPVLDRCVRVHGLELGGHLSNTPLGHRVEVDQRRTANDLRGRRKSSEALDATKYQAHKPCCPFPSMPG